MDEGPRLLAMHVLEASCMAGGNDNAPGRLVASLPFVYRRLP